MDDSLKDLNDIVAGILADADAESALLISEAKAYAQAA
jgi:hypothetical protein